MELFGGGQARLELEDETDILGCGIEIKAQPPGKTLKTISLLSGGEKAFVAIALYFSILKVHPTPFCVMDEIEAALDDVNVTRYARYMRNLAGKTQFIVITHRRGTMEEADVLYGVTMQEKGVSKILTINLNDMAKDLDMQSKGERYHGCTAENLGHPGGVRGVRSDRSSWRVPESQRRDRQWIAPVPSGDSGSPVLLALPVLRGLIRPSIRSGAPAAGGRPTTGPGGRSFNSIGGSWAEAWKRADTSPQGGTPQL